MGVRDINMLLILFICLLLTYVILCRGTYIEDLQIVTTEGAKKQCPLAAGPTPGTHSCFSALLPVRRAP